jgi:hypothetical protein
MNNAHKMRWILATYRLSVLSIVLMMTPVIALAEREPGYENYKEGHKGYLGDGILTEGESDNTRTEWSIRFTLQLLFPRGG